MYKWVGSSFTGEWYCLYPREDFATSGSFIVSVLPEATYINIGNPSLLLGVIVTLTIEIYLLKFFIKQAIFRFFCAQVLHRYST